MDFAPNTTWKEPFSTTSADREACRREVGWFIEWFLDPVFKGSYPSFMVNWFSQKGAELTIEEGDMELIQQPVDFIGINYYEGSVARYQKGNGLLDSEDINMGYHHTDIGWPVYPDGFYNVLCHITQRYGDVPIYITENGACYNNEVQNGRVMDTERIDYLKRHMTVVQRSLESGVNIKGYIVWSLLDNFEWAEGYTMRFGLVHVNYRTLERTKKESYYWYQKTVQNRWFEL